MHMLMHVHTPIRYSNALCQSLAAACHVALRAIRSQTSGRRGPQNFNDLLGPSTFATVDTLSDASDMESTEARRLTLQSAPVPLEHTSGRGSLEPPRPGVDRPCSREQAALR